MSYDSLVYLIFIIIASQCILHYRVLFADHKDQSDLVAEFFMQSGIKESLRAEQLTLEHFNQLCLTYEKLCNNITNSNQIACI